MILMFPAAPNTTRFTAAAVVDNVSHVLRQILITFRARFRFDIAGNLGNDGPGHRFDGCRAGRRVALPVVALAVPTTVPGALAASTSELRRLGAEEAVGGHRISVRAALSSPIGAGQPFGAFFQAC